MQDSLAEEFNKTAVEAHAVFPHDLDNLVLLLPQTSETPVYVSPEIAQQLTENIAEVKTLILGFKALMYQESAGGVAVPQFPLAGMTVRLIALDQEDVPGLFSDRYTREMRIIFNLDHEIGHHILKNGHPYRGVSEGEGETVCDVFAMLRHIQRFGNDTDNAGYFAESRAYTIVLLANAEHYTTNAVQGAIQYAAKKDISRLSLEDTAALAEKIAKISRVDDETLEKVREAFAPAHENFKIMFGDLSGISKAFYSGDKDAYGFICSELLATMEEHQADPDVMKAGRQFFSYPPIRNFVIESAKTEPYWQAALAFIESPAKPQDNRPLSRHPHP